jgi:hypothetical protein
MNTQKADNPTTKILPHPPEVLREQCQQWWDLQAAWCVILNADGWTDAEIAAALGVPLEDVIKCLYPTDDSFWGGLMKQIFKKRVTAESDYRAEVTGSLGPNTGNRLRQRLFLHHDQGARALDT